MTTEARVVALMQATEDQLDKVDRILTGNDVPVRVEGEVNLRLLTVMDACRRCKISYPKMNRIMNDGLVDVVGATGRRMITEASLIDFCQGRRKPTPEVMARRNARNAARREQYRKNKTEKAKCGDARRDWLI